MSAYYFFSGFGRDKGFTPEIGQSLRENIKERKSLAFIASCPYAHEKTDFYQTVNASWFRNIGIEFENVYVIDDRKPELECAEAVNSASAAFLAGGTTLLQFDFIKRNNLIPVLKQFGGVIMGMSAGAINMAVNSFSSADEEHGVTHIYKGIGLADVSVEPHFSFENKTLIENDLLPFSDIIDIYAVCDGGAVAVIDDKRRYFGNVYLVSKGGIKNVS